MIVVDTHVVLWLAERPELLSRAAREAIERERGTGVLAVSDMTLLELARLIVTGQVAVQATLADFLRSVEDNFQVLPITGSIAERTMRFQKGYPRDPIDRVVGATALVHGARLVTKDEGIRRSGEVECVW